MATPDVDVDVIVTTALLAVPEPDPLLPLLLLELPLLLEPPPHPVAESTSTMPNSTNSEVPSMPAIFFRRLGHNSSRACAMANAPAVPPHVCMPKRFVAIAVLAAVAMLTCTEPV